MLPCSGFSDLRFEAIVASAAKPERSRRLRVARYLQRGEMTIAPHWRMTSLTDIGRFAS
jgi:hypothetical protein